MERGRTRHCTALYLQCQGAATRFVKAAKGLQQQITSSGGRQLGAYAVQSRGVPGPCLFTTFVELLCVPPRVVLCCALQITGRDLGSRKKKGDASPAAAAASPAPQQSQSSRGQKFRARKSREAAAKAAEIAGSGQQNGAAAATATSQQEVLKVPDAPPSKN